MAVPEAGRRTERSGAARVDHGRAEYRSARILMQDQALRPPDPSTSGEGRRR